MKIGILTLSSSDNCGSLLQTYALQKVLELRGHNVEIINFKTVKSHKMYRTIHFSYIKKPQMFIGQFLRCNSLIHQRKAYQTFRNSYLNMTPMEYHSNKELSLLDGKYDVVLCGSDQVWNVYMHDFDKSFLLSWCNKSMRVAYAASLGDQKNGKIADLVAKGLDIEAFKVVSVRERSSQKKFLNETNLKVDLTIDPTLLLKKDEWMKLINKSVLPQEKYIFYYSYNYGNEKKNMMVRNIAKKLGLTVYVINASKWVDGRNREYGFKLFKEAGPIAFLSLMSACEYSLVESFHGCIFAYIFYTKFFFLAVENLLDDRIEDLLYTLNLKQRVLRYGHKITKEQLQEEYEHNSVTLDNLLEHSNNYLDNITSITKDNNNGLNQNETR